jgi:hypothetical protein
MKPLDVIAEALRKFGSDVLAEDIIALLEANGWRFTYNRS